MCYSFNDNVYFVKGSINGCIYDFNTGRLYSINSCLANKLDIINELGIIDNKDENLKKTIDQLIEKKVIVKTDKHIIQRIEELRNSENDPMFAWIEITKKCNMKCIHCYNESDLKCQEFMSEEDFYCVVDQLKELSISRIQIIGGEPFYDKNRLKRMMDYTLGKFEFVEIFTNGTLIDEFWIGYLKKNNIKVALSVYSYIEEEHDKVTGVSGSLKLTNRTIKRLKEANIDYRVCNVLMKNVTIGDKNTDLYELNPDKDVVRMSGRASTTLISEELLRKKVITQNSFKKPITRAFSSKSIKGHNCFSNKIYISADLNIYPCVMERRISHGRINRGGKITLLESIKQLNKDKVDECCHCEYRYACFDCRSDTINENIYEKPWYCTYMPDKGKWIDLEEFILAKREEGII